MEKGEILDDKVVQLFLLSILLDNRHLSSQLSTDASIETGIPSNGLGIYYVEPKGSSTRCST